jgi:energy-coupling factor transporter ATP-binding protein EcfA2
MRLVWVSVHGYRRFAEDSRVNVDLPVVAVVGPNEAGKSSLLQAIARLSDEEPFEAGGEGREFTRSVAVRPDQRVVGAEFLLEAHELEAIRHIPEATQARWLQAWKRGDGRVDGQLVPTPRRDRGPRRRAAAALRRALESRHLDGSAYEVDGEARDLLDDVEDVLGTLDSDAGTLERASLDQIEIFAQRLKVAVEERHPKYFRDLPEQLASVIDHERAEHPHTTAFQTVFSMRPEFLLFSEDDRTLNSTYELDEVAHDPPAALGNLAGLAQLDLVAVRDAARASEWGRVESLVRGGNEELERVFHESWRQAAMTLRLRVDGTVLRLLVETVPGRYDFIADRSDGLRWFIALLAYTETQGGEVPPVLLVDEAESHLHYDAQADLVRVFARQRAAAKVIYTTHSAGCLPEDLGAAIRVVAPVPDSERSEVRNWFWEESPGFSPLFLGMGASALAFTAVRRAVIAEGAADLILLPSVLREATGRSELGFQVAPGLAEVSPDAIDELGLVASRVAYIVDGDAGGRAVRRKLIRQGVPEDLIVAIRDGDRGLALEDLLDHDTYLAGVNEELRRSRGDAHQMSGRDIPNSERPAAIDRWCRDRGIDAPSKRAIANRLLERDAAGPLVARRRVAAARALFTALTTALERRP